MTIAVDTIVPPEPKRDRFGRYVVTTPDGKKAVPYTRATTIAKTLEDQYNLTRWSLRKAIKGATSRPDLITSAQAHDPDTDRNLYEGIVDQALDAAGSKSGATVGTALHRFTEDVDSGRKTLDEIPDEWRPTIDLYQRTLTENGVTIDPRHIERVLLWDDYEIAGTADRIVTLTDDRRLIADLKTSRNVNFGWLGFGVQLAIYANHTATYDYTNLRRGKRIDVDRDQALVIHLPSQGPEHGTCTLYTVDIAKAYDAFLCAIEARGHRTDAKKWGNIYTPHVDLTVASAEWIRDRVKQLAGNPQAVTDLRNRWPDTVPQPFPDAPTPEQINALAAVLDRVEATHEIPFGDTRPKGNTNKEQSA